MREFFADAGYWIALISPRDRLRERAIQVTVNLGDHRLVTSQMVLVEVLNHFAGQGDLARKAASETVIRLKTDPSTEVIEQSSDQFAKALELYGSRLDQTWSLVDCSSFVLMEERGIRDALAHDVDFVQAGFNALLRGVGMTRGKTGLGLHQAPP